MLTQGVPVVNATLSENPLAIALYQFVPPTFDFYTFSLTITNNSAGADFRIQIWADCSFDGAVFDFGTIPILDCNSAGVGLDDICPTPFPLPSNNAVYIWIQEILIDVEVNYDIEVN